MVALAGTTQNQVHEEHTERDRTPPKIPQEDDRSFTYMTNSLGCTI